MAASIMVVTTLTVGSALAAPKVKDRPLKGKGTGVQTLYADASCPVGFGFTVVASENLSSVGSATFVTKGCVTSATASTSTSTSTTITTAANGDTFTSTETSTTTGATSVTTSTITGGTGRFANASGTTTVNGVAGPEVFPGDPNVVRSTFSITGTIRY